MKVSKQEKAAHREQIIAAAARQFREKGFDGISVSDLMKEVGLTHGGFYGHFASKEELIALGAEQAMRETGARWEKVLAGSPERPLEALADFYLSPKHQADPSTGCILAALGSELGRQPQFVKEIVMKEQERLLSLIAAVAPGRTRVARRRQAIHIFARLIGGMMMARSVPDPAFCQEILSVVSASVSDLG